MSDDEREKAERAIRREQQYLFGGAVLILGVTALGALMLALGVQWYWTLLMIPTSALGALATFEARASAHARQADDRQAAVQREVVALRAEVAQLRVRMDEMLEEIQIGRNAERAEHQHLIEQAEKKPEPPEKQPPASRSQRRARRRSRGGGSAVAGFSAYLAARDDLRREKG